MNLLYRKSLSAVFTLLLAVTTPLFAQHPVEIPHEEIPHEKVVAHPADEEGASPSKKAEEDEEQRGSASKRVVDHEEMIVTHPEEWLKERSSEVNREYFGRSSSAGLKRPFNDLVDNAIVSICSSSSDKQVFRNAGNQQIKQKLEDMQKLAIQNQRLKPAERLTLKLNEPWYWFDTIDVSKEGSSESATIYVGTLRDQISEAVNKLTFIDMDMPGLQFPKSFYTAHPGLRH